MSDITAYSHEDFDARALAEPPQHTDADPSPNRAQMPHSANDWRRAGEIWFFLGLGTLLELASAAGTWIHLFTSSDNKHPYVLAMRLMMAVAGLSFVGAAVLKRGRIAVAFWAGLAGLLLPLLAVFVMLTHDPASVGEAIHENTVARQLLHEIDSSDVNPYVAWTEQRQMASEQLLSSEYTAVDGYEAVLDNAKMAWFMGVLGGVLLMLGAIVWDRHMVGRTARRYGLWVVGVLAVFVLTLAAPIAAATYHWNMGRRELVASDYPEAFHQYELARTLDPRFDSDVEFQFDLGRVMGQLGMTRQQDYWATVADSYLFIGWTDEAYATYTEHVTNPRETIALAERYQNALLYVASLDFNNGDRGDAMRILTKCLVADPNNLQVLYDIALIDEDEGDFDAAEAIYRRMISLNESVGLYKNRYFVSYNYRKTITARAWKNLSYCYYKQHRYDLAEMADANSDQTKKVDTSLFAEDGGSDQ